MVKGRETLNTAATQFHSQKDYTLESNNSPKKNESVECACWMEQTSLFRSFVPRQWTSNGFKVP